jgi:tetratricopeptide (TPR) repeat protein
MPFDDPKEQIAQLKGFLTAGEIESALELADSLHKSHPENVTITYLSAWARDANGAEEDAVVLYEAAIERGLGGEDLRSALLGLGSTYRHLGQIRKSYKALRRGIELFPDGTEFRAFLALTLYTAGRHKESVSLLLELLAETSNDQHLRRYQRALLHYAGDPDSE